MLKLLPICLVFSLAGCLGGPIPPTVVSGNNLSTEHGTARLEDALMGAKAHCESKGMAVKRLRTDCPFRCMSSFECTAK